MQLQFSNELWSGLAVTLMTLHYSYDQKLGNLNVFCNTAVKLEGKKGGMESGRQALGAQIHVCGERILACKPSAEV